MKLLRKLINSFKYASRGIVFCVTHETNMRIHIVALISVMFISLFYDLSGEQYILLILTCLSVISLEMINTAIEVIIDKVSPEYSALAKVGKDVAAGAVFLAAIAAVVVGIIMFWDINRFVMIFRFFVQDIGHMAYFIAYLVIAYLFITRGKKRKVKGKVNK